MPTTGSPVSPSASPTTLTTQPACLVIGRALAVSAALTAAWGLLSGLTEYHFTVASLLVGLILAKVLTRDGARRPWLPVLAAALAFAVGFVGDAVAVAVALWAHYGIGSATIAGHFGDLFDNVAAGHSGLDWVFFILAAIAAAGLTAGRQHTGLEPNTGTPPAVTAARDEAADVR